MPIPSPADFRNKSKKHSEVREMMAQMAESAESKDSANTKANTAEANAKTYSNQLLKDIKEVKNIDLSDLSVTNSAITITNGILNSTVASGYAWMFVPEIINVMRFKARQHFRFITLGKTSDNKPVILDIGNAATFGRIYSINNNALTPLASLNITGKTNIVNGEMVELIINGSILKVIVNRLNIDVELFTIDLTQFVSTQQLGFAQITAGLLFLISTQARHRSRSM